MADSSFDIVSKVERQEVDNALNQAGKEISQRYDFKNVGAEIRWSGENIEMRANSEERLEAWPQARTAQAKGIRDETVLTLVS